MLNLIKRQRDTTTMITVFNVAFNSTAADVKALYPEVKFRSDREPKPGVFVFELDQDEALKFTEIGGKVVIFQISEYPLLLLLPYENLTRCIDFEWKRILYQVVIRKSS